jgi:RHS repeat-associated protein
MFKAGIQDRVTGWVKFGARWYSPALGRWTQHDTLDAPLDPKNANRYAFAANDPINNSDPTGLWYISVTGTVCLGVCQSVSFNWGNDGIFVGHTTGVGFRAELSIGAAVSPFGSLGGSDVPSAECSGIGGSGYYYGSGLTSLDIYAGAGYGYGGGCSINFTDYYKLH